MRCADRSGRTAPRGAGERPGKKGKKNEAMCQNIDGRELNRGIAENCTETSEYSKTRGEESELIRKGFPKGAYV